MKTILTAALLAIVVATPALAQLKPRPCETNCGQPGSSSGRPAPLPLPILPPK